MNKLFALRGIVQGKWFRIYAFWIITCTLIVLLYMILLKQIFSLRLIITFCVLLALWLSFVASYLIRVSKEPPEIKELGRKFQKDYGEARSTISGAFYRLPFFIIMGETGAGKTTLIKSSGFKSFQNRQSDEEKGVGGTQGCDWFIRKEAIFLDTAGLMVADESKELWHKFLEQVRDARRLAPVNGLLLVIPVDKLCGGTEMERVTLDGRSKAPAPEPADEGTSKPITLVGSRRLNPFLKDAWNEWNPFLKKADEEKELKALLEKKATALKQRVEELVDVLKFQVPMYTIVSKCDLLAEFRDFSHMLSERERDRIVGMTSFREFDYFVESLQRWHLAKTIDKPKYVEDIYRKKAWMYLENIRSLKPRLQIYDNALSKIYRDSEAHLLRGYFFSSCKQHMVLSQIEGAGVDWQKRSHAYFVYELFHSKLLKEKGMGKPALPELTRRVKIIKHVKIAAVAVIAGLILYVAGYFWKNYSTFSRLEQSTANLKSKLGEEKTYSLEYAQLFKKYEKVREFHEVILTEIADIYEGFKTAKTRSSLFVASKAPLETQFQKIAVIVFYSKVVLPALEQFLYDLEASPKSPPQNAEEFVARVSLLYRKYENYQKAKQDLDGFEEIYHEVYQSKISQKWPKVKNICLDPKIARLVLSDLEKNEEKVVPMWKNRIKEEFINLCKNRSYLERGNQLYLYYREISEAHAAAVKIQPVNPREKTWDQLARLARLVGEWQNFAESNLAKHRYAQDYYAAHQALLKEDLERNLETLRKLGSSNLFTFDDARIIHDLQQARTCQNLLQELNSAVLGGEDTGLAKTSVPSLYDIFRYHALQIELLPQVTDLLQKNTWDREDFVKVVGVCKRFGSLPAQPHNVLYYPLTAAWDESAGACLLQYFQNIQNNYTAQSRSAARSLLQYNPDFIESGLRNYRQKIQEELKIATKDVDFFAQIHSTALADPSLWKNDLVRLQSSVEAKEGPRSAFLEPERLKKIVRILQQKGLGQKLRERDYEAIIGFLPHVYTANPSLAQATDLLDWAHTCLKHEITSQFQEMENEIIEHWEVKANEFLARQDWPAIYEHCERGKILYEKFKEVENPKIRLMTEKYLNLIRAVYDRMVDVFALQLKVNAWNGQLLIRGEFPLEKSQEFLKWGKKQLADHLKIFGDQYLPVEVFKESERYQSIRYMLDDMRKADEGKQSELDIIEYWFTGVVVPWLKLKEDPRLEKLSRVDDVTPDWVGKSVLDLYENIDKGYAAFVLKGGKAQPYITDVLARWRQEMSPDFDKWHSASRKTLEEILTRLEGKLDNDFPFRQDSAHEVALRKADDFFKSFAAIQREYKIYMVRSNHDLGREWEQFFKKWQDFFATFEAWQALLYGRKNTEFALDKVQYQIEVVLLHPIPHYITRISFNETWWDCGSIVQKDPKAETLISKKEFTFDWTWGKPIVLKIEAPRELQASFSSDRTGAEVEKDHILVFKAHKHENWKLFEFIYNHFKDVTEERIDLSIPYKVSFKNDKTLERKLEIGFLIRPWREEGKFPLPWKP